MTIPAHHCLYQLLEINIIIIIIIIIVIIIIIIYLVNVNKVWAIAST